MPVQKFYEKFWIQKASKKRKRRQQPWWTKSKNKLSLSRYNLAVQWALESQGKLLDIGCGKGELLFRLKDGFEQLVGVDIAQNQIRQCQRKAQEMALSKKLKFIHYDLNEKWPFPKNSFDIIVCLVTLEYLFDPFFIISQVKRTLKPGGVLILSVANIAYIKQRLRLLLGRLPKTSVNSLSWDGGILHYFNKKSLIQLLRHYNFEIVKISGTGLLACLRNWWPSLLTGDIFIKAQLKTTNDKS